MLLFALDLIPGLVHFEFLFNSWFDRLVFCKISRFPFESVFFSFFLRSDSFLSLFSEEGTFFCRLLSLLVESLYFFRLNFALNL